MIKSKLFIRFAILGIIVSGFFLILSILTTQWMRALIFDEPFRDRGPFRAFELLLEKIPPAERIEALEELRATNPGIGANSTSPEGERGSGRAHGGPGKRKRLGKMPGPTVEIVLLDENHKVLFPENFESDKEAEIVGLLKQIQTSNEERVIGTSFVVRRLSGEPPHYVARALRFKPPSPPPNTLLILTSVQLASIIAAVLVTLAVVLYSLRTRARQADAVMKELSSGNLKARIPITKMDEVGQTVFSFNKMADEIEHLIEHLRKTENARRDLLRELAHDLRTPVASLKSLIETVSEKADQLPTDKRKELLGLAMKEADYFEGLVDDLLFLGRVGEPKYKTNVEKLDVTDLIETEVNSLSARYSHVRVLVSSPESVEYDGDPSLIKRLVRNALENAVSFARSEVRIALDVSNGWLTLKISDDGPGFDPSSLATFGQRKYSRAMTQSGASSRISIGLGSVIMKSITDIHRGDLVVTNRLDESGAIAGADVLVRLPLS